MRFALALVLLAPTTQAQWQLQQSNTTADLRGIDSIGNGVAWASGSKGTVLHTTDNGTTWQPCTTPPGAEALDFRGVQAFDATTAIVMSSGKGDLSRLYKTTDGCRIWKLVITNPDAEGFWDSLQIDQQNEQHATVHNRCFGAVIGDPVGGSFPMFLTFNCGDTWERQLRTSSAALPGEGLFAASNQALLLDGVRTRSFVTGSAHPRIITFNFLPDDSGRTDEAPLKVVPGARRFTFVKGLWDIYPLPTKGKPAAGAGAFAMAQHEDETVVVGGDYALPAERRDTAWYRGRDGWLASVTPPNGYRSSVAYASTVKAWIAVGPNGTDLSVDAGKHWRALHPAPQNTADADQHWNALSLPFVVGPHGRIGLLRDSVLKAKP